MYRFRLIFLFHLLFLNKYKCKMSVTLETVQTEEPVELVEQVEEIEEVENQSQKLKK